MKFDPSSAVEIEASSPKGSSFDPESAVLFEEEPKGLVSRFKEAVKWGSGSDLKVPEGQKVTDATFSAGIPEEPVDLRAVKLPGSVMDGQKVEASKPLIEARGAPVNAETYAAVKSNYDSSPSKRKAMAGRGDWMGSVAGAVKQSHAESDMATAGAPSAGAVDPRLEARMQRLIKEGSDRDAAYNMAKQASKVGALPGQENTGYVDNSAFDFDLAQTYKDANPVLRGAVKGYEGYRQGVLGVLQAGADVVGANGASDAFAKGAKESSDAMKAMGDGKGGAKLFEGAVSSIAQQLPLLIGGAVTGSEALVLGGMAAQSFGQEYSTGRSSGLDGANAAKRASLFAAFEVVGEKFGLSNTLKALRMAGKGANPDDLMEVMVKGMAKEVPGEVLTTSGQFLTDKNKSFGLNKEAGWAEYINQVAETIGQTVIQSGIMIGGTHSANAGVRQLAGGKEGAEQRAAVQSAEAARQSALNAWSSRGLSPSANAIKPQPVAGLQSATTDEPVEAAADAPVPAADMFGAPEQDTINGATSGVGSDDGSIAIGSAPEIPPGVAPVDMGMQPRDRGTAASILQLKSMANNPDFARLGASPIADVGAPLVSVKGSVEGVIPEENFGKGGEITFPDGSKVPFRYAVVSAKSVLASHDINGRVNDAYNDAQPGDIIALTNGRKTALEEAYRIGTATQPNGYMDQFIANADEFQVSRNIIAGIEDPILIRAYDDAINARSDIGRQSNGGGSMGMSAQEVARNDAAILPDLGSIVTNESGEFDPRANAPFVRGWVAGLSQNEQAQVTDRAGNLSQTGATRLRNAIISRAYGDSSVFGRLVESLDDDMRNVGRALVKAAPKIAKVRELIAAGAARDMDISADINRAVDELVRLRQAGISMADFLAQASLFNDQKTPVEVLEVLSFLDANIRSANRIADFIGRYYEQVEGLGSPDQSDMFGAPELSRLDILRNAAQPKGTQNAVDGFGGAGNGSPQEAGRDAADAAGIAGGQNAPGVSGLDQPGAEVEQEPGNAGSGGEGSGSVVAEPKTALAKESRKLKQKVAKAKEVKNAAKVDAPSNQGASDVGAGSAGNSPPVSGVGSGNGGNARAPEPGAGENPPVGNAGPGDSALTPLQSDIAKIKAKKAAAEAPAFDLAGQTPEEISQQERDRVAAEAESTRLAAQEAADKKAAEKKSLEDAIKERAANPDNFQFGEDGKAAAKPMGGLFDAPAPSEMDALKAEMGQAIGELASILGAKKNLTPEEESRIIPVMSKIFRIAAKMGLVKFKDAAKYVIGQIREMAGKEVADKISIDNLQAGYINVAKEIGGDKREAMAYDSLEELEKEDVTDKRSGTDLERDSPNAETPDGVGAEGVSPERGGNDGAGEPGVAGVDPEEDQRGSGDGMRDGEAAIAGERGNIEIYTGSPELSPSSAGNSVDFGSGDIGLDGLPIEPDAAGRIKDVARSGISLDVAKIKQRKADKTPQAEGLDAIKAALPILSEGQQEDVLKTETRFAVPDGYGMLFTNGTGTGKTFSGLGVIKRFANSGKQNILIIAPSKEIIDAWQKAGKLLGLELSILEDTNDAGKGIVITTYANMGANNSLASRDWDLVVHDEAHYLAMDKDGTNTNALKNLRAISLHPDGVFQRHSMLYADDIAKRKDLETLMKDNIERGRSTSTPASEMDKIDVENDRLSDELEAVAKKLRETTEKVKADVAERQLEKRTRVMFLSATPFAYEKTVDWANGYIFDYNEGRASEENSFRGYNAGSNRDQFMMQHFGYRMRTGKLTQPDAKVDSGLMQRQFNSWLKKKGSLSGRMLDVAADYDRRFILVDSAIGQRIDEALQWFEQQRKLTVETTEKHPRKDALAAVSNTIAEKFDYLSRRYLLESIKAREVVPHIREHLAMGRKVVVFHDYKKGGGFNPFNLDELTAKEASEDVVQQIDQVNRVIREFRAEFKDLINSDLFKQSSPIDMFKAEFADVLLFNGDVPQKQRRANVQKFQDDASGPQVILVQSAAGKEGISLHDATGKHQRVLFNLGQPTAPTTAIQEEGRIYRTGQVTDAIIRYLNTGTNWEKWAFATTIATRASAAENLGMGELARSLKDAFITGFEESGDYRAGMEGEGKGGKERDKAANNALTEYDRARAFYFGTQKKNSKTKAQEGADYFATPEPVGLKMVEWADIRPGEKVLEPSAGHGAIARWMPVTADKTAIEPSMALRPRLAMVFDGQIIDTDFESMNVVNKFDAIVMNPPFGSGGKTAVDHLAKAATHLRDGGRIVALLPTGPAADKKFDKWMYGEEERALKPIFEHPTLGPIYRGDTIETNASFMKEGVVTRKDKEGSLWFKKEGSIGETMVAHQSFKSIKPTGPRKAMYRPAEGLYSIADIKMPAVTFERAGTQVMTRIVVIEKQSDAAKASDTRSAYNRDFTNAEDINDLFDQLENMALPGRAKAYEQEAEEAPKAGRKAKPVVDTVAAQAAAEKAGLEIIEHTTGKGKVIRGVVRTDLSREQAKEIDEFTFKKDGGWFIREKHLVKQENGVSNEDEQGNSADAIGAENESALYSEQFQPVRRGNDAGSASGSIPGNGAATGGSGSAGAEGLESKFSRSGQTDSAAFRKWFGGSKVVDSRGNPLVVYHGAPDIRGIFADGFKAYNRGGVFFAAADYDVANSYALDSRAADYQNAEPQTIPLYLSIQNPMIVDAKGSNWKETERHVQEAKDAGHDGIIIKNSVDYYNNPKGKGKATTVYAWFSPTQAKSAVEGNLNSRVDLAHMGQGRTRPIPGATGNNGDFDGSNPDIRYARSTSSGKIKSDDLNAVADSFRKEFPGVTVNVLESTEHAPKSLRNDIKDAGAMDDVAGAFHAGSIYLFQSGIRDIEHAQETVVHEGVHAGLSKMFGDAIGPVLLDIWQSNLKVQLAAKKIKDKYGYSRVTSIEEALADMGPSAKALKGWSKLVAWVRAKLRKLGAVKQWTDNDVEALVLCALAGVKTGGLTSVYRGAALQGESQAAFSRSGQSASVKDRFNDLTSPDRINTLIYNFQNNLVDLKNRIDEIKKANGTLTDLNDAYLGEEMYHGKVMKKTGDFLEKEVRPLLQSLLDSGIAKEDFETFLHARHAPEANQALAERNPNQATIDAGKLAAERNLKSLLIQLQTAQAQGTATKALEASIEKARAEKANWSGAQAFRGTEEERLSLSGMSDQAAALVIANIPAGKRNVMGVAAMRVDAIQAKTLAELERYGLMDKVTLDAWRGAYKKYVPLHRDEAHPDSASHPIGQGFSVKGDASKRRTGSNEKVTNILGHIAMQREAAITRGEKNSVSRRLYLLAAQNPDRDFWSIDQPAMIKTIDDRTGFVRSQVDPTYKNKPNVLMLRIAGKDLSIVFNEKNPEAVRLAQALKNLDGQDLDVVERTVGKVTRYFAAINTQYNPIFGLVNLARDSQAGILNLTSTAIGDKKGAVAKGIPAALRAIYRAERGKPAKNPALAALWQEFQEVGGQTGYRDMYASPEDRTKDLERELNAMERGDAMKRIVAVGEWLSDYNTTMENSVRLSAYKVAVDGGMSKERAASLAKNLTVNFNRKGAKAQKLGAFYAFFNASAQGSARLIETMKGPAGRKILIAGIGVGVIQQLAGMMMGGDDEDEWDKIPDFIKERSLIIPIGGGKFVTIPMPLGFNVLPNIGRLFTEWALGGKSKPTGKQIGKLIDIVISSFNPLGGTDLVDAISPTIADPVIALLRNKDWTGKPIYRADRSNLDPTPGFSRTKDSATPWAKGSSYVINMATGGSEYRPGGWSPTPDQIDYVIGQVTGGVGREAGKLAQTVAAPFTGDELPAHKIPLFGRLYGTVNGPSGQSERYYENIRALNGIEREIKGRAMDSKDPSAYMASEPLSALVGHGNGAERAVRGLQTMRRTERKNGNAEKVKELDAAIAGQMKGLNMAMRKANQ